MVLVRDFVVDNLEIDRYAASKWVSITQDSLRHRDCNVSTESRDTVEFVFDANLTVLTVINLPAKYSRQ